MNTIPGKISEIDVVEGLSLITVDIGTNTIQAIVIDTPDTASYLKHGNAVNALIKETEVLLSTEHNIPITVRNRIPCTIVEVIKGGLLAKVKLQFESKFLYSIVPASAVDYLQLSPGQKITALFKTNEVMLSQ